MLTSSQILSEFGDGERNTLTLVSYGLYIYFF